MAAPFLLKPKPKDLGDGFTVRRVLPAIERRSIGPFIFLDEMGPVTFAAGQGLDVRPHPHIGLATVTYLFDGAIEHKDSLGTVQVIRPGDVNLMTAGRGIVHSERSPQPRLGDRIHGIQFWVALPRDQEERAPGFEHTPAASIPEGADQGLTWRLLAGRFKGVTSPVTTFSPMLYLDLAVSEAQTVTLPSQETPEQAIYVTQGALIVDGIEAQAGELVVLQDHAAPTLVARSAPARCILFGGAPVDGPRKLWWNFVSSRPERIEQAKAAWAADAMGRVAGDAERIPLPEP